MKIAAPPGWTRRPRQFTLPSVAGQIKGRPAMFRFRRGKAATSASRYWENTEEDRNSPGFREDERSRISSLLEAGWFDLVRDLNPDERIFSWWSPRKDFYKDDKGLRIDLVFGNAAVVRRLQCARIDRGYYADRGRSGKPDHAPVVVDLA